MKECAARSSAFQAELRLGAAAFAAACRVRRSRARSAAQVCERRRLSGWEILRGLRKPPRSPTRGRDKPICGAKRRRGSLRRRTLGGKCVFVGMIFWEVVRGAPRRCANGGVCRGGKYCGDWESRPNVTRLTSPECGTLLRGLLPRFASQSAKVAAPSSAAAAAFSMSAASRNAVPTPLRHALLIYTCGSLRSPPFLTPNSRKF